MAVQWCYNAYDGDIFSYTVNGEWTDFPRGTLIVYGDYLTTGLASSAEAEAWAQEYGRCDTCKRVRAANAKGKCIFCDTSIQFMRETPPVSSV